MHFGLYDAEVAILIQENTGDERITESDGGCDKDVTRPHPRNRENENFGDKHLSNLVFLRRGEVEVDISRTDVEKQHEKRSRYSIIIDTSLDAT